MPSVGDYRGLTILRVADTVGGGTRAYTLSVADVDPLTASGHQTVWEGDEGSSIVLRAEWATSGSPTFAQATNLEIFNESTGNVLATIALGGAASGSSTFTLHFRASPDSGASALSAWGKHIGLRAAKTNVPTWDAASDGTGSEPAATTHSWAGGYFRSLAKFSATDLVISNASLGGATPSKFSAPETTYTRIQYRRTDSGSIAFQYEHRKDAGATIIRNAAFTAGNAGGSAYDFTWATATSGSATGRINKDYPTDEFWLRLRQTTLATMPTGDLRFAWSATGLPAGWSRTGTDGISDLVYDGVPVDPRFPCTHLLQVDDNAYGTPPMSKNVGSGKFLAVAYPFLSSRFVNSRGEGVANGALAWTTKLWDATLQLTGSEGSPTYTRANTSATKGGELGWADGFLSNWDKTKPGGAWTQKEVITTADLTGLEQTNTRTLTLISTDPRIRVIAAGGPQTDGQHFQPGQAYVAAVAGINIETQVAIQPDSGGAGIILTGTYDADPRYGAFLDSDGTWKQIIPGTTVLYMWPATETVAGSGVYMVSWTAEQTAAWPRRSIVTKGRLLVNGVPYGEHHLNFTQAQYGAHETQPSFGALADTIALGQIPDELITLAKMAVDLATQAELDTLAAAAAAADAAHAATDIATAHPNGNLPEARVTFADGGHDHTGGVKGDAVARGGGMTTFKWDPKEQPTFRFIARFEKADGTLYTNAEITAAALTLRKASDASALVNAGAMTYNASLGGYYRDYTPGAAIDAEAELVFEISPTLAGGVPPAIARPQRGLVVIERKANVVWDEPLTGATHNGATTAGKRLRQVNALSQVEGSVVDPAPTATSFITNLGAGKAFHHLMIAFTSGANTGEAAPILEYDSATQRVAVEAGSFPTAPADGDSLVVIGMHVHPKQAIADTVQATLAPDFAAVQANVDQEGTLTRADIATALASLLAAVATREAEADAATRSADALAAIAALRASVEGASFATGTDSLRKISERLNDPSYFLTILGLAAESPPYATGPGGQPLRRT